MKINFNIPSEDSAIIDEIISVIKNSNNAFITMHTRPDGDALGAALAISAVLKQAGHETRLVFDPRLFNDTFTYSKILSNIFYAQN